MEGEGYKSPPLPSGTGSPAIGGGGESITPGAGGLENIENDFILQQSH